MSGEWMNALVALQAFHVVFLLLHDWVPLGRLSNLKAVREENPGTNLVAATLVSSAPFVVGLAATAFYFYGRGGAFPGWVRWLLSISYVFLFVGELQAWWFPYLFGVGATPEKVKRFRAMFDGTIAFLPERNGIRVNTLHVILHVCTVALLVVLAIITR